MFALSTLRIGEATQNESVHRVVGFATDSVAPASSEGDLSCLSRGQVQGHSALTETWFGSVKCCIHLYEHGDGLGSWITFLKNAAVFQQRSGNICSVYFESIKTPCTLEIGLVHLGFLGDSGVQTG